MKPRDAILIDQLMRDFLIYWFSWVNVICWIACFWWMHRISARQCSTLKELKDQGMRIEGLSQTEHDMLKEVHPKVTEIKEAVSEVVESRHEQPETRPQEEEK
ncbi:MAG TPA: hypothetical protein VFB72_09710 [Verrucomicrobiae bacterium]|nr:hypothetical protein [Verrucomicrobiae bacterium]